MKKRKVWKNHNSNGRSHVSNWKIDHRSNNNNGIKAKKMPSKLAYKNRNNYFTKSNRSRNKYRIYKDKTKVLNNSWVTVIKICSKRKKK